MRTRALLNCVPLVAMLLAAAPVAPSAQPPAAPAPSPDAPIAFIDTSIENASPLWYERDAEGVYHVHLLYDHERNAPNRAAGHIHFRMIGTPGARVTLEFRNLDNVWNGRHGSVAAELKTVAISPDGETWTTVPTDALPGSRVRVTLTMPGDTLYLARMQPYRLSDLDRLLSSIRTHPRVAITPIGKTVAGRSLEIVRIGRDDAPRRVFLRARAHPWEAGSSWVVHGLIERLLQEDVSTRALLDRYVVYVLPMANKDGVALGRTRFNLLGKDLNRNWNAPTDAALAPENAALERWLEGLIADGRAPHLALEMHNDGRGLLHISRPPVPHLAGYLERMARLESILRQRTWFTEGHTDGAFRNSGTLGDGWLERYGVDALVHELNANWIEGRQSYTSSDHWRAYGASLADVFGDYFSADERVGDEAYNRPMGARR